MRLHIVIFIGILIAFANINAKSPAECHRSAKEICKDKPSGQEKFECMKAETEKDPECKKVMEEGKKKFFAGEDPCKVDREKCRETAGGHMEVMKCLHDKRAELSDSCKKHIEEKFANMPCFEDKMKFCKDVKRGKGRMHECLKKNLDQLSAECKEKVSKTKKDAFDTDM